MFVGSGLFGKSYSLVYDTNPALGGRSCWLMALSTTGSRITGIVIPAWELIRCESLIPAM